MKFEEKFKRQCRADRLRRTSERSYWQVARRFILWAGAKSEEELKRDATENFREFVAEEANRNVSVSTQNTAFHGLRYMFERVLTVKLGDLSGITRATREEIMVDVPPMDVAKQLVNSVPGLNGLVLRCQLASALRVSDGLRIRVKDLDFGRKQIAIQESKGGKSRMVPMSENLLPELQALVVERTRVHENDLRAGLGWVSMPGLLAKKYPKMDHSLAWQWLFYSKKISTDPESGNIGRFHILPAVVQRAMAEARERLKITAHYTPHCLRHATAQFWEKEGIEISKISQLLGHKDIKTTQRYLQSGRAGIPKNLPTPI
jgi:integrase